MCPSAFTLTDEQLAEIDARLDKLTPVELVQRRGEMRAKGLAILAGFQTASGPVAMAQAVEMLALYETRRARDAYRVIRELIASGELTPKPLEPPQ